MVARLSASAAALEDLLEVAWRAKAPARVLREAGLWPPVAVGHASSAGLRKPASSCGEERPTATVRWAGPPPVELGTVSHSGRLSEASGRSPAHVRAET